VKFIKQRLNPHDLSGGIGKGFILRLSTRPRHNGCLRALHDTRLEPRKIANPPIERRVRIMREEISSAWLGSHILHCLYTQEGVQDYNRIVYMKPILSQDRIATKQDSIWFYL
jgi:hypothetical protein